MYHVSIVGDTSSEFATPGLIDSPTLESDAAESRRALIETACNFDPENLYGLELDRDYAIDLLESGLPADLTISIYTVRRSERVDGKWAQTTGWMAMAFASDPTTAMSSGGENPTEAAKSLVKAWTKAHATTRTTPVHAPIVASTFESLGRVTDAPAFLKLLEETLGITNDITVEADGRVLLSSGQIGGSEAAAIGAVIAEFNLCPDTRAAEDAIRVIVEPRGASFKAILILPSGERIEVAGVTPTESSAREWARQAILARRSTVPAVAIVASASSAA